MTVAELPAVRRAVDMIGFQLELVRRETPDWPPLQQLQEARRRCLPEILAANQAMALANAPTLPAGAPGRPRRRRRG